MFSKNGPIIIHPNPFCVPANFLRKVRAPCSTVQALRRILSFKQITEIRTIRFVTNSPLHMVCKRQVMVDFGGRFFVTLKAYLDLGITVCTICVRGPFSTSWDSWLVHTGRSSDRRINNRFFSLPVEQRSLSSVFSELAVCPVIDTFLAVATTRLDRALPLRRAINPRARFNLTALELLFIVTRAR